MAEDDTNDQDDLESEVIGIRGSDGELLGRVSIDKNTAHALRQRSVLREIEGKDRPYIQLDDPVTDETLGEIQLTPKEDKIRVDITAKDPNVPRSGRIFHGHSEEIVTSGADAIHRYDRELVGDPTLELDSYEEAPIEKICPHCEKRNYLYGNPLNHDSECVYCNKSLYGGIDSSDLVEDNDG